MSTIHHGPHEIPSVLVVEPLERDVAQEGDEVGCAPCAIGDSLVEGWGFAGGVNKMGAVEEIEEDGDEAW